MSINVNLYANRFAVFNKTQNDHTSAIIDMYQMNSTSIYVGYEQMPQQYARKGIKGYSQFFFLSTDQKDVGLNVNSFTIVEQWDETTVLEDTKPQSLYLLPETTVVYPPVHELVPQLFWVSSSGNVWNYGTETQDPVRHMLRKELLRRILTYGIAAVVHNIGGWKSYVKTSTAEQEKKPFLQFLLFDEDVELKFTDFSPIGGYVPKYAAKTFSWATDVDGFCVADIHATDYKLQWRAVGGQTINTINCGTATSYTIPANTFTDDDIEWRVKATDDASNIITSEWMQFSTEEAVSTAVALSPKNEMISGAEQTKFKWNHIISTGTAQTRADLEYSYNGSTFTALGTVSGAAQEYTVAKDFFSSGQVYWRVKTYNTDDVASAWSDIVSFICIAPPMVPVISATQTPKPVITWQTTSQQGYEIVVENSYTKVEIIRKVKYGTETSYTLPMYLNDGTYTVKIRAQNKYGIWSEYGTAPITVANTAGSTINVIVANEGAAIVSIITEGNYDAFVVYRDGIAIAKIIEKEYRDYFAIGMHTYTVRGIYNNSNNYGISDPVIATLTSSKTLIFDVNEKNMIDISNSTASLRDITTNIQHTSKFYHASSADYPVAEITRYRDQTMSLKVGFMADEDTTALEELRNKIVCVKTVNSDLIVGTITNMAKTKNEFITSYTISVRKINFEEEIEL